MSCNSKHRLCARAIASAFGNCGNVNVWWATVAICVLLCAQPAVAQSVQPDSPLVAAARKGRSPERFDKYAKLKVGMVAPPIVTSHWFKRNESGGPTRPVLINFWSTTCGGCIDQVPAFRDVVATFNDRVDFVSLHIKGESRKVAEFLKDTPISGAVGIDTGETVKRFGVTAVPTYILVDGAGVVRLKIHRPPTRTQLAAFFGIRSQETERVPGVKDVRLRRASVTIAPIQPGEMMRDISATTWLNSPPLTMRALRGRVVLIDAWATWCRPCLTSLPTVQAYADRFGEKLTVIGVHYKADMDAVASFVAKNVRFPVAIDTGETWERLWINHVPTYLLVDSSGVVRSRGTSPPSQEQIEALLREKTVH